MWFSKKQCKTNDKLFIIVNKKIYVSFMTNVVSEAFCFATNKIHNLFRKLRKNMEPLNN